MISVGELLTPCTSKRFEKSERLPNSEAGSGTLIPRERLPDLEAAGWVRNAKLRNAKKKTHVKIGVCVLANPPPRKSRSDACFLSLELAWLEFNKPKLSKKSSKMFENVQKCWKMLENVLKNVQKSSKKFKKVQNVQKC